MRKRTCCPKCKSSDDVIEIMYGLPTPEAFKEAEEGKIMLGGCVIESGAPDWFCGSCKHEWSDPKSSDEDES